MTSKEELGLLLNDLIDGIKDILILVKDPEPYGMWKILNPSEARALVELILAKATDEAVPPTQLCLTIGEAAKQMGVSVNTFNTLVRRKDSPVPSIKVGRRTLIPYFPLKDWLNDEAIRQNQCR